MNSDLNTTSTDTAPESFSRSASLGADASLFGVAVIWGVNIPLMKIGLYYLDNVFVFNAIRLTISAAVLLAFATRERWAGILPRPGIRVSHVIAYAVIVSIAYQMLFLVGINLTTAGNTALIIATVPIWTALLARLLIGEELPWLAWLGLAIGLVGTVIVALQKGDVSANRTHLWGNLFIVSAAVLWAAGTVFSRPMLRKISPLQLAAAASLIGLPAHVAVAAFQQGSNPAVPQSVNLWLIIAYAGILSSGLAQPMWHYGVRHAGAAHASVIQNLIPLVAIFAAWVLQGVQPNGTQLTGGALILGGLVTMRLGRVRRSRPTGAAIQRLPQKYAQHVSDLALRSKAYWGYSSEQMVTFRDELTLSSEQFEATTVYGIFRDDSIVGFYNLVPLSEKAIELEHLFVDPAYLRQGLGTTMMRHARDQCMSEGAKQMIVLSDPNAAGFYERLGGELIDQIPSSIPGRTIPKYRFDLAVG